MPLMMGLAPSGSKNSCRSISIPASMQRLDHADTRMTGRRALDLSEDPVTLALVEAGRLKGDRVEHRGRTAAPPRLGLGSLNDLGAEAMSAQRCGQKEQVDEEETQGCAADEAS